MRDMGVISFLFSEGVLCREEKEKKQQGRRRKKSKDRRKGVIFKKS